MRAKFSRETRALGLTQPAHPDSVLTEEELAPLPGSVQRYLRFMGAVGQPRVWSLRAGFRGKFWLGGRWRACETLQYNSRDELARIFYMTLRVGFFPVLGRDTYVRGKARMLGRALDLFTVVDGSGPEFDISELVTYLNDAILMAPSMLLWPGAEVTWSGVDDRTFNVRLTNLGVSVGARVFLDDRGAPMDFSTTDRFTDDPAHPGRYVRARWTTPMDDWMALGGRQLPVRGKAVWHREGEAPFPYADFELIPESVAFNAAPGE